MSEILRDDRKRPIFIHSCVDDLGLTMEAFRVYSHLARRAGENNTAYPSYKSIGEHCFRGSYPNSSDESLKKKAIDAVQELIQYGLIQKVENRREDGSQGSNTYHLTDREDWKTPNGIESCNIRKGRPGKTRAAKSGGVNGDNRGGLTGITGTVNGDNRGGLTGITGTVNGGAPKGYPSKGNPSEVNPHEESAIAPKAKTEEGGVEVASLPEPTEPVQSHPVNPNRKPEGTQETQERIGGDQSSAAKKICEGELTTHKQEQLTPTPRRYRSGVQKAEDRFRGKTYPWEIAPDKPNPDFVAFLAKQLPNNGESNPLLKAHYFVINQRVSQEGIEKLAISWDFFVQELEQRKQSEEMRKASPATNEAIAPVSRDYYKRSPEELEEMRRGVAIAKAAAARRRAELEKLSQVEENHGCTA